MKLILYHANTMMKEIAENWAKENQIEVTVLSEFLTAESVKLAKGYDGIINSQAAGTIDKEIYSTLREYGIRQIALVSAGYELYDLFLVNSLKKECVFVPKLYNLRNSLREEVVENFGEVVVKEKVRFSRKRLLVAKKDLLWVDFSYQLFDKVPFLTILPKTYCTIVFGIRRLILKLKDGI